MICYLFWGIIFCGLLHANSAIHHHTTSANIIMVYVSPVGADSPGCGDKQPSACRSLAYAYTQTIQKRSSDLLTVGAELGLVAGRFMETVGITVEGVLDVIGRNKTGCHLLKPDHSTFVLFSVTKSGAYLTIANLTILLTNNSLTANYIRCVCEDAITVTVSACIITMRAELKGIEGNSFYVNGSRTSLGFDGCTVFNVTTQFTAFVGNFYSSHPTTFGTYWMRNSSFINMINTYQSAGCFSINNLDNLTLTYCQFAVCRGDRGVGSCCLNYYYYNRIESSTFWNTSYKAGGGVLSMWSSTPTYLRMTTVYNVSSVGCSSDEVGSGFFHLQNLNFSLDGCNFVGFKDRRVWNVLQFTLCIASLNRCTFVDHLIENKGAVVTAINTKLTLIDCAFVGIVGGPDLNLSNSNSALLTVGKNYVNSLVCTGACADAILLNTREYVSATCSSAFSSPADRIQKGACPPPCAASIDSGRHVCVMPDACGFGRVAVGGVCIPQCAFWKACESTLDREDGRDMGWSESGSCPPECMFDDSLGYPLCVVNNSMKTSTNIYANTAASRNGNIVAFIGVAIAIGVGTALIAANIYRKRKHKQESGTAAEVNALERDTSSGTDSITNTTADANTPEPDISQTSTRTVAKVIVPELRT